jgi:hypothetical protein
MVVRINGMVNFELFTVGDKINPKDTRILKTSRSYVSDICYDPSRSYFSDIRFNLSRSYVSDIRSDPAKTSRS